MQHILITGATGNIGQALLAAFRPAPDQKLLIAVRKPEEADETHRVLDIEQPAGFRDALRGIHTLFLLRPPHISDVRKYFAPLVEAAVAEKVAHIVFLSVQGADKAGFVPHAKIEKLIQESGIGWTFIRPSYFMQNLSTTLRDDIRQHNLISLPAGNVPFLWVDVMDIGRAIAAVLQNVEAHRNQAYDITGKELLPFSAAAELMSQALGRTIRYESPNLFRFYRQQRRKGVAPGFIMVMMLLHFLPRLQKPPKVSAAYQMLTGSEPVQLSAFLEREKAIWM